jgi:high affinity Mn2+ porin
MKASSERFALQSSLSSIISRAKKRRALLAGVAFIALAVNDATAADLSLAMPLKAPASPPSFDWNGFYLGGHASYATGTSSWSATQAGAATPTLAGSLSLYNSFDAFKATGSYILGVQAGYNVLLPSRVLLGIEGDLSAPAYPTGIGGSSTFSSAAVGQASYGDTVLESGTVRARVGYELGNNWLLYATGGFAWSYDRLTRTQIAGTAAGGSANPGDTESPFLWRLGWAAGAGVEFPLAPHWSAKAEYLLTDFGRSNVTFFTGAQRFDSDLLMQSVRVGVNYHFDDDTAKKFLAEGPSPLDSDRFNFHGQTTLVEQYVPPFHAPSVGPNSLYSNSGRETFDLTFFAGFRLWEGAELWIDPEIDQGFGLTNTLGVAGFPSGEAYKVGFTYPYARLPRAFVRQTIDLDGESQKVEAGINQFAGAQTADRLVITVGKFGAADVFDTNRYAHDPRSDFLNWSIVDTGTFDYTADAWGYSYGGAVEWYTGPWTVRAGVFDQSTVPNSTNLDPTFHQFQLVGEIEHRHELWGEPGKIAVTGFLTRARLGRYDDAVQVALATGNPADITAVRQYTSEPGISFNLEQQLTRDIGLFARAGYRGGAVETDEFTDIDRTLAAGLVFSGSLWGRADDTIGLAGVINGLSSAHRAFLNAGGLGVTVGDGTLPNYAPERIIETYYSLPLSTAWRLTFDYQFVDNPGYNNDRGPVSVFGTRLHSQF